jgi:nucleoid DNA-binding protein
MREQHKQHSALVRRAPQHVHMRAIALTTRDAMRVARRKCLTFTREYVSMHVMEHSNAAVARGENASSSGFGLRNRAERTVFTGCKMQTAEGFEIAASMDAKFTAGAGFVSAVS